MLPDISFFFNEISITPKIAGYWEYIVDAATIITATVAVFLSAWTLANRRPRFRATVFCRRKRYFPSIIEYKISIEHYGDLRSRVRSAQLAILKKNHFQTVRRRIGFYEIESIHNFDVKENSKIEQGDFFVRIYSPDSHFDSNILFELCKSNRLVFIVIFASGREKCYFINSRKIYPSLDSIPNIKTYLNNQTKNNP